MKKILTKAVKEYVLANKEKESLKELSDNTGVSVAEVKKIIDASNNESVDEIIKRVEQEEEAKTKKKKKIAKFGVSDDGQSVVMTPTQSKIDDEIAEALRRKDDFLKTHSKHIHIIKPKDE